MIITTTIITTGVTVTDMPIVLASRAQGQTSTVYGGIHGAVK